MFQFITQFLDAVTRRNSDAKKFKHRVAAAMRAADKAEAEYRAFKKAEWPTR